MIKRTARVTLLPAVFALGLFALGVFAFGFVAVGCGGGEPEGEATWETHTTAPDESAGSEETAASEESPEPEAAAE